MTSPNPPADPGTEALLCDAAGGDAKALGELLDRHRERLRRMVAFRLDSHLAAHLDASDIVQEALADAVRKLPDYSEKRPLPFYPWLHRLASERLAQARRRHRREAGSIAWPDGSANLLADRLIANDPTPGHALIRAEQRQRVRAALDRLAPPDSDPLHPVWSCFGGLGVYRMECVKAASYGGDDCEQVVFHRELREKGLDRLFLNPSQIVVYEAWQ